MNYFEIFNKVLLELNYRPIGNFETIYKSEHTKILDLINRVNSEVLASYSWPFLEKNTLLEIEENKNVYELPFKGSIKGIYKDEERLLYVQNAQELFSGSLCGKFYSIAGGSIIFEKGCKGGNCRVLHESCDYVLASDGKFKEKMSAKDDVSILPMPFAEHILVYGTCLKVKANPSYPKFGFWNTMYVNALRNLLQKSPQTNECEPFISLS